MNHGTGKRSIHIGNSIFVGIVFVGVFAAFNMFVTSIVSIDLGFDLTGNPMGSPEQVGLAFLAGLAIAGLLAWLTALALGGLATQPETKPALEQRVAIKLALVHQGYANDVMYRGANRLRLITLTEYCDHVDFSALSRAA